VFFDTVQLTLLQPVVTKQHHRGKKLQVILSSPVWAISKKQRGCCFEGADAIFVPDPRRTLVL
jgi:hypothetical protein